MPRDGAGDTRRKAEERVRQRFEQERAALLEKQRHEAEELQRRQQRDLQERAARETRLREARKQALARLDQEWALESRRLSGRAQSAPSFGLFPPPQRDMKAEYKERRTRWEERVQQNRKQHDAVIAHAGRQLEQTREQIAKENRQRQIRDSQARRDLAEKQAQSFARGVREEMDRSQALHKTFEARARRRAERENVQQEFSKHSRHRNRDFER